MIFIDNSATILDHLKLTSKSYIKSLLTPIIDEELEKHEDTDFDFVSKGNECLEKINVKISQEIEKINKTTMNSKFNIGLNIESFESIFDKLITYSFDEIEDNPPSLSSARELLYSFVLLQTNSSERKTIVLIDDFDSNIDEELTINIINNLKNTGDNIHFILTSNKPSSLPYLVNIANIYSIKNSMLLNFSDISYFINNNKDIIYETFEEYMINGYYGKIQEEKTIKEIQKNLIYNFGRILTSKNYCVYGSGTNCNGITILPNSEAEKRFYENVEHYINKQSHSIINNEDSIETVS